MKIQIVILCATLAACATDDETQGPPHVDEAEQLGDGKGDGALALGTFQVRGQQTAYRSDGTPIRCHQGGTVAFDVTYENQSLPWGVELSLWRGMAGEEWCGGCEPAYFGTFDWQYHEVDTLTASGPYRWSAHTEAYGFAADAGGRFTAMKYVVRIRMPDGSIRWDNGGSSFGYYEVPVPPPDCDASWTPYATNNSPLVDLPVKIVKN